MANLQRSQRQVKGVGKQESVSASAPSRNFWQIHSHIVLICVCLFVHGSIAYDMRAVDVSNTSYYRQLSLDGHLVTDQSRINKPLHLSSDDVSMVARSSTDGITSTGANSTSTALPSPFDTSLGNNFTDASCPTFFSTFLQNSTFQSCLPISLLLQNSLSFFQTARSVSALEATVDTSCGASLAVCSPLMAYFADQLMSNCGDDYQRQNPIVMQAHAGFVAYEPLYKASCLKDAATGQFCFVEALTNASASADSYPYYTAIGLNLPNQSRPTCDSCLKQTMQIFSEYAVEESQPLASTYLSCATQVNQVCGSTFANTQVKVQTQSQSNSGSLGPKLSGTLVFFISLMITQVTIS